MRVGRRSGVAGTGSRRPMACHIPWLPGADRRLPQRQADRRAMLAAIDAGQTGAVSRIPVRRHADA